MSAIVLPFPGKKSQSNPSPLHAFIVSFWRDGRRHSLTVSALNGCDAVCRASRRIRVQGAFSLAAKPVGVRHE